MVEFFNMIPLSLHRHTFQIQGVGAEKRQLIHRVAWASANTINELLHFPDMDEASRLKYSLATWMTKGSLSATDHRVGVEVEEDVGLLDLQELWLLYLKETLRWKK